MTKDIEKNNNKANDKMKEIKEIKEEIKEIKKVKENKVKEMKETKKQTKKLKDTKESNMKENKENKENKEVIIKPEDETIKTELNSNQPLMRKATALWLLENTSISFKQIAEFCNIHPLEIQAIADGESSVKVTPLNPIDSKQLTREMITACEKDFNKKIELNKTIADEIVSPKGVKRKNNTYVPISKRGDKPDGIAYLLKFYPDITDKQIRSLINTTTPMIESIRNKTHWNIKEVRPRDPVLLGLCSQTQFNAVVGKR